MEFFQSLGFFGWSLLLIAVACMAAYFTKRLSGRAEAETKIHQSKTTLNTPPPVGGGIGGNL